MTVWLWVFGALVVVGAVYAPYIGRARRDPAADRARDLLSRLEYELDRPGIPFEARAEAERCQVLAGSALASGEGPLAERWARAALAATAPGRRS